MLTPPTHIDLAPALLAEHARRAAVLRLASASPPLASPASPPRSATGRCCPSRARKCCCSAGRCSSNMQRRFEREHIDVSETEVVIEYAHGNPQRVVFPRHWAQVKIRRPKSPLHRGQLVIESHGRGLRGRKVSDRGGAPPAGCRTAAPDWRHEPVAGTAARRFTGTVFLRSSMSFHMKNANARRGLQAAAISAVRLAGIRCARRLGRAQHAGGRHHPQQGDLRPAHAHPVDLRGHRASWCSAR